MPDIHDSPEMRKLPEEAGVIHNPGMADSLLAELSPLLAAEGIDLSGEQDEPYVLQHLNEAFAAAAERRNFALFSPVGAPREAAITILRGAAEALDAGDPDRAAALVNELEPEPEDGQPSIANVIGVALGLLDAWFTSPVVGPAVAGARIPPLGKRPAATAPDILALAKKGRAFDSITPLIRKHGGEALLESGVLVVALTLHAWAVSESSSVSDVAPAAFRD